MKYLLQVEFPHEGPFKNELTVVMSDLAKDIAKEPGLISKLWIENEDTKEAGGTYLFTNLKDTERYFKKHKKRLESFGYKDIRGKIFLVNEELSNYSIPK